jgi:hypothetical protein
VDDPSARGGEHRVTERDRTNAVEPGLHRRAWRAETGRECAGPGDAAEGAGAGTSREFERSYAEIGPEVIPHIPAHRDRAITFDEQQRGLWATKTRPVVDEWVTAQEAAGRPAKQLIEDVKAVVRRYQDVTPNDLMRRAINQPLVLNAIKVE